MADTFDVVVQVYDDVSGELKGDANVKTSAGMTYFSDGESLQEKVDSGEFTSGEQGPEGPPGPNSADLISVVDTEGLLGTPGTVVMSQNLFDAIVDSVANKLLPYARLANNGLTTEEGFALDARYGKTLKLLFDSVNSNLPVIEYGDTEVVSIPANGYIDITVTHAKVHSKVPICLAGISASSTAAGLSAGITPIVINRTLVASTIRLLNSGATALNSRCGYVIVSQK